MRIIFLVDYLSNSLTLSLIDFKCAHCKEDQYGLGKRYYYFKNKYRSDERKKKKKILV